MNKKENIIAFSLWGDNKLYCQGAIDNIECAKKYMPDWTCRFYVAKNCPALPVLLKLPCEVIDTPYLYNTIDRTKDNWKNQPEHLGMLWRFMAIDDPNIDNILFRDCDSRITQRDTDITNAWLSSGYVACRIHEHVSHWNSQIMGGMFSCKAGIIPNITEKIKEYITTYNKSDLMFIDLWFLMDVVFPQIEYSCIGYGLGHPNPIISEEKSPIGTVICEEWRNQKFQI